MVRDPLRYSVVNLVPHNGRFFTKAQLHRTWPGAGKNHRFTVKNGLELLAGCANEKLRPATSVNCLVRRNRASVRR